MGKLLQQKVATNMLENQIGLKTEGGGFQMEGGVCFNVTSPGVKELRQILVAVAQLVSN